MVASYYPVASGSTEERDESQVEDGRSARQGCYQEHWFQKKADR